MSEDRITALPSIPGEKLSLRIYETNDAIWCSRRCASLAKGAGFTEVDLWELSIAVSELVTNVLKYAGEGTLEAWMDDDDPDLLCIKVEDSGPGIADIAEALEDGVSEGRLPEEDPNRTHRRGLGAGLGAVNRLMSEVRIENKREGGVVVTASKRRSPAASPTGP